MKIQFLLLLMILIFPIPCFGSSDSIYPVRIIDASDDLIGYALVAKTKDFINNSGSMFLVRDYETMDIENRIDVIIQTLPYDPNDTGAATTYSIVWILFEVGTEYFLDTMLGYSSEKNLDASAENIVIQTKKIIDKLLPLHEDTPMEESNESLTEFRKRIQQQK